MRSDIEKYSILDKIGRAKAYGFNRGNGKITAKNRDMSLKDELRELRNNPKRQNSPYKLFEGVLVPKGTDENGDIIYFYNPKA